MTVKANKNPSHRDAKLGRIREPHVAPLNALADKIATARGVLAGAVPYVDPDLGGIHAHVLGIAANPGPMTDRAAQGGSGMLSLENNDESAAFCHREYARVGVSWSAIVHWNAVPFPTRTRTPTAAEKREGLPWLPRFLALFDLAAVRVVVLFGNLAQDMWKRATVKLPAGVHVVPSKHPSRLVQNRSPENRAALYAAFDQIGAYVNENTPPAGRTS